jgi:hypothetical protein
MSAATRSPLTVLEEKVPLSQSLLWRLQREFYTQRGLRAWTDDLVPQYITNNPFIAEIHARMVFAFLSDCSSGGENGSKISATRPIRIVELGAGPGKFCYLFLRKLTEMMRGAGIPAETVRYFITDTSENLLASWTNNAYLKEFAESGLLRFEKFEAGQEDPGTKSFAAGDGPLVVIANYVFDSLPQDAFVVGKNVENTEGNTLLEALVTTRGPGREIEKLSSLEISFDNAEVASGRYQDPIWNGILEHYRTALPGATVLFPAETLKTLEQLRGYSNGQMLVVAADKGCVHKDTLRLAQGVPPLEMHASDRCFSQMVNFHAIGKYFEAAGGAALLPEKHSGSLSVCAFVHGGHGSAFPATYATYHEIQSAFAPDDLFALLGWLDPHMDEMSIPQILATLRLTHWDPIALIRLFPAITRQVRNVTNGRHDLRSAVLKTWANHFPVTVAENALAFQCGVILLELRFFADALPLLKASQQLLGRSAPTSYNLALCHLGLDRRDEALASIAEACVLDPAFEPARLAREKLEHNKS